MTTSRSFTSTLTLSSTPGSTLDGQHPHYLLQPSQFGATQFLKQQYESADHSTIWLIPFCLVASRTASGGNHEAVPTATMQPSMIHSLGCSS